MLSQIIKKIRKLFLLKSGFTMIEVIISIVILSIGILASYFVIQGFISSLRQSSLRLTAAYLAQEGIEIVRNIRDENYVKGEDWRTGINEGSWEVDYNDSGLSHCSNSCNFNNLRFLNTSGSFYSYDSGEKTPFKRKITITYDGDNKTKVAIDVWWVYNGEVKGPIDVQEILYKWR